MATIDVKDAAGSTVAMEKPLTPGSAAASASRPVTSSTEDVARVGSVTETAPGTDTASSGLNGRLQRISQRITSMIALLPTSLGGNGGLKIEGVASGTAVPVSIASVPSHAVTNAGTFAVQAAATLAAETTKVIGTVNIASSQTVATVTTVGAVTSITNALPAGTNAIGKLAANSGVNIGTVTVDATQLSNLGTAAMAASAPVTVATDDTQFARVLAALRPRIVQLVPTVDATACAQYDVWAATEVVTSAAAAVDIPVGVRSVSARRLDSTTGLAFRVWFLKANSSVGAENAAFAPADADADDLAGYVDFAAADFINTTGMVNCFAKKEPSVELWVTPATGTTSIYIAIQVLDAGGIDVGSATDLVLEFQFI